VHNIAELRRLVSQTELDRKIDLQVKRDGKQLTLSTKLKEQPANYQVARAIPPNGPDQQGPPDDQDQDQDQGQAQQGSNAESVLDSIEVRELTPDLAQHLGVPQAVRGVVISKVGSDIPPGQLQPGDVIEAINQEPVTSVQDYNQAIQSVDPNQPQVLSICRQRSRSFVVIEPR
jgi:serine protease Do